MSPRSRPHLPMRPAWLCRNCAAAWPCSRAQLDLVAEFYGHSLALALYLASCMNEAIHDLYILGGRPDFARMHVRFLGWLSLARRPRRPEHE
ncbi:MULTISPECIES: hypothetical protein [Micromonospora]|nr:hypothetical protein [Micromonospora sp. C81]MBQ1034734.1 hypothetical protein [Micromonospora sp. C81]WSK48989.1 hypothetical protein OG423_00765 [Micromonospora zamorensis]WTI23086.1 hypothetical protein OG886_08430 [Micromonospora zamorensis]